MFYSSTMVADEKQCLEQMIQNIVEASGPDKIYHRAGLLLIVLSDPSSRPFCEYKSLIDASVASSHFHYTFLRAGDLEQLLLNGHLFYSTLCMEDYLVYDSKGQVPFLPISERLKSVAQKITHDYTMGQARAHAFLKGAIFYLGQEELGLAAFMLHQATEQALRAFLTILSGQEVRTHSITELKQHLKRYGLPLDTLLQSKTEEDKYLLDRLEKAYTCARYTNRYEITLEDLLQLLRRVKKLLQDLESSFKDLMDRYLGTSNHISHPLN